MGAHVDMSENAPLPKSPLEPLCIRPVELSDAEAFHKFLGLITDEDLFDRFGRRMGRNDPAIKRFLFYSRDKSTATFGAFHADGAMIGSILMAGVTLERAELGIIVAPHLRSMGVGRRLVGATRLEAERRGLDALQAHIAMDNRPAVTLARRCGFEPRAGFSRNIRFEQRIRGSFRTPATPNPFGI